VSRRTSASSGQGVRVGALRVVSLDLVGPLVVYRICRGAGLPAVWSLVISGGSPGLGVVIDYARWRTLDVVGGVILTGIGLSVVLAVVSGSPRAVLLESAGLTAGFGVLCFASLVRRRPLLFYFIQAFRGGAHSQQGRVLDRLYDVQQGRYYFRTVTKAWGAANLFEAAVLAVVVFHVSTGSALACNRIVPWLVGIPLFIWSYRWGMRLLTDYATSSEEATA